MIMKNSTERSISTWVRRNRGLMTIYSIGFIVVLLQLRSIL